MTIWKRRIQRDVLCGLLLGGLVAFATTASAADFKPAISDHAEMAVWFEKAASANRQKANDLADMKAEYAKNPSYARGYVQDMPGVGGKTDIPRQWDLLIDSYTKAAEQAEQIAKMHRGMMK